jgi:hypothetical protein
LRTLISTQDMPDCHNSQAKQGDSYHCDTLSDLPT